MKRLLISVLLAWAVAPVASLAQYTAAVLEINSKDGVYADVCDKPVNYVFSFGDPGAGRDYKKVSLVGAIVAPEAMIPGYTAPKDLKKFWTKQIKRMRELIQVA